MVQSKEITETRTLKHVLSAEEKADLSGNMARAIERISSLQSELKAISAEFKSKIAAEEMVAQDAARAVNNGWVMQPVKCVTKPAVGRPFMETWRTDTWELIAVREMTEAERQENLPLEAPSQNVEFVDAPDGGIL